MKVHAILLSLVLAGCGAPLPLSSADVEARKMQPPPQGKAVVYLVRDDPDHNRVPATITLGENHMVTTYPGTYYRWEVAPGRHQIAGFAADNGEITLQVEAGKTYYVQQWTAPWLTYAKSDFRPIGEVQARSIISRSVMVGG